MRHFLSLLTFVFCFIKISAQPAFEKNKDTVYLKKEKRETYAIKIKCTGCDEGTNFSVKNTGTGDLPSSAYTDGSNSESFKFSKGVTEKYFYVTLHPTKDDEYKNQVIYQLFGEDEEKPIATFYLRLEEEKANLGGYRLLVGTNFDFIDGIDAKAPYYHLQVFQPKGFSSKFGFVGGFQRNRQVSFSDTINSSIKLRNSSVSYRLSKYSRQDSLYQITKVDSVSFKRTRTANVFSIYFEPTFRLFPCNNARVAPTSLYVFGHADIVFRKNIIEEEYAYSNPQLMTVKIDSFVLFRAIPEKSRVEEQGYEFYYGGGLMLHHENSAVDIYAKFMIGAANIAERQWYYYYGGEIGIREKSLNIMFGAEYRGTGKQYNPNYLNVYLSKVFSLGKLIDFIKG